ISVKTMPIALNLNARKSAEPVFAKLYGEFRNTSKCVVPVPLLGPICVSVTVPKIVLGGPQSAGTVQWLLSRLKSKASAAGGAATRPAATIANSTRTPFIDLAPFGRQVIL